MWTEVWTGGSVHTAPFTPVFVAQRAQQDELLCRVRLGALEVARLREHGLDGAKAEVVVILRRELFRAQAVRLHELPSHVSRFEVAERVENNLRDHRVIGHHHRDVSEQRLEVIRQLGAAGVPRVHRDEDVRGGNDSQFDAFELERLHFRGDRALDAQHLLRHDG